MCRQKYSLNVIKNVNTKRRILIEKKGKKSKFKSDTHSMSDRRLFQVFDLVFLNAKLFANVCESRER